MAQIDKLPPLREVVRAHGLSASKQLGQNFLFDLNLTQRIARAAAPLEGRVIVEIGPGPGGLTRALLAEGAERVIALEKDARCLPALAEIAAHHPGRLEVIHGDALAFKPPSPAGSRFKIVANLPYNIGTALLVQWLSQPQWPPWFESLTLMFQREVAERITATPEQRKAYGRLAVLCGWRTEARILFDVPPQAFFPPPSVTSSIVSLTPRMDALKVPPDCVEAVTARAFGQRRKMLRQSLKGLPLPPEALLAAAGAPPTARAEEIPVAAFLAMAARLAGRD